jgi:hypothetical protein
MKEPDWMQDYSSLMGGPEESEQLESTAMDVPDASVEIDASAEPDWMQDYSSLLPISEPDPVSTPEAPVQEEESSTLMEDVSDMGAAFGRGSGHLVGGLGWITDALGMEDAAEGMYRLSASTVDYYNKAMSPESKAELEKEFVTVKEGGKWYNPADWERPEDAAGLWAAVLMGMESIPATATGMGVGGKVGQGIFALASKTKTMAGLVKVAEVGAKRAAAGAGATDKLVKAGKRAKSIHNAIGATSGAIGGGLGEAIPAAGMAGLQVEEQVMAMTHEDLMQNSPHYPDLFSSSEELDMPFDERVKLAKENLADMASTQAGVDAGIATFLLGAPAGAISAPLFNNKLGRFASGKWTGIGKGALTETVQEFTQSGSEQYLSNLAIKDYADENMELGRGVVNASVGGAVSGGLMGAAFGVAGTPARAKEAKDTEVAEVREKRQEDATKIREFGTRAAASLAETHGMEVGDIQALIDPILKQFVADENILSAVSSFRHLEKYGRVRELGVDDQAGTNDDIPLQQETVRNGIEYGMVEQTVGADGGRLDYLRPEDATGTGIYVIEQVRADGSFDEHKIVLGVDTEEEARAAYQRYYRGFDDEQDRNIGSITAKNEVEFAEWAQAVTEEHGTNIPTQEVLAEQEGEVAEVAAQEEEEAEEPISEEAEAANPTEEVEEVEAETDDVPRGTQEARAPKKLHTGEGAEGINQARIVLEDAEQSFEDAYTVWEDNQTPETERAMLEGTAGRDEAKAELDRAESIYAITHPEQAISSESGEWIQPPAGTAEQGEQNYQRRVKALGADHPSAKAARIRAELAGKKKTPKAKAPKTLLQHLAGLPVKLDRSLFKEEFGKANPRVGNKFLFQGAKAKDKGLGPKELLEFLIQENYISEGDVSGVAKLSDNDAIAFLQGAISSDSDTFSLDGETVKANVEAAAADHADKQKAQEDAEAEETTAAKAKKVAKKVVKKKAAKKAEAQEEDPFKFTDEEIEKNEPPRFSLSEKGDVPWTTKTTGEGDLYISRHGDAAGTPHKTRQGPNDLVISFDQAQLLPEYAYFLLQYLQPKIAQRARGTAQQAIRKGDVDDVLREHFSAGQPRYSLKELARRSNASENMREINRERAEKKGHLMKTVMRADWSKVEAKVDAATAGALTPDEIQEAMTEWMVFGTASKYFQRWFGESKTTDAWGEPVVFYHGTSAVNISVFTTSSGFVSLSTDPALASKFAGETNLSANRPVVYPLYVKAEKVFDYRNAKMMRSFKRWMKTAPYRPSMSDRATQLLIKNVRTGTWEALEHNATKAFMKERQYDAFWMTENGITNLGVFDPRNIKSSVGNAGTFSPETSNLLYSLKAPDTAEVFYSAVERWIAEKMPPSMPTKQASAAFSTPKALGKKGVKAEEVEDLGLLEWLEGLGAAVVTREQMMAHVRANKVTFSEVESRPDSLSAGAGMFDVASATDQIETIYDYIEVSLREVGIAEVEIQNSMTDVRALGMVGIDGLIGHDLVAKYDAMLHQAKLDLWQAEYAANRQTDTEDRLMRGEQMFPDKMSSLALTDGVVPTYREFLMRVPQKSDSAAFKTHHWEDENVLVHMRMFGYFDSATGKTSLVIEEIQSDWHQRGYRYGYNDPGMGLAEQSAASAETGTVPASPFKKGWKMVGMKRMIRYAVENGYDSVAWTTGDMQKERYDLSKHISSVALKMVGDKFTLDVVRAGGGAAHTTPAVPRHEMGNYITEELADKLFSKVDAGEEPTLSGDEMRWEAKALMSFYDGSLKKATRTYIKKWDSKVELRTHPVPNVNGGSTDMGLWTFDVTRQMHDAVMAGQSLYSLAPTAGAEINRRLELYQLRSYIENNTNNSTKPKAMAARLIDGVDRGFFSAEILRHAGVMGHIGNRTDMLMGVSERLRGMPVNGRTSISSRVMRQELARMTKDWANPPVYNLWDDVSGLPDHVYKRAKTDGVLDRVEGLFDPMDGQVHMVAENIGSMQDLHRIFTEEALGHHGLRSFFKDVVGNVGEMDTFLDSVLGDVEGGEAWDALLASYTPVRDMINSSLPEVVAAGKRIAVEELVVKREVSQTVWEKFVSWFREALRRAGLITRWTENDIIRVMDKVHTHVVNGATPHSWGKRNHNPAHREGALVYSLYGGPGATLVSNLEEAIKRIKQKGPPKNFLNQLMGRENEANGWTESNKFSKDAAGKMGFTETELGMTGLVPWLIQQNVIAPKKAITPQQMVDVFNKTKPRIQVVSRGNTFLYPHAPLSQLLSVRAAAQKHNMFDRPRAEKDLGFLSDKVRSVLDERPSLSANFRTRSGSATQNLPKLMLDHAELRETLGHATAWPLGTHMPEALTPAAMWAAGHVSSPFGRAGVPTLPEFREKGLSSKEIGKAIGMEDIDAPISYLNSDLRIKAMVADLLLDQAEVSNKAYQTTVLAHHVGVEGYGTSSEFKYKVTSNYDGEIESVHAYANSSGIMSANSGLIPHLNDKLADWKIQDSVDREAGLAGAQGATQSSVPIMLERAAERYIREKIEQAEDNPLSATAGDIFPEYPEFSTELRDIMEGSVSFSGGVEYSTSNERSARRKDLYEKFTLRGGKDDLDVISLALYWDKGDNNGATPHYEREDVVHIRLKTRTGPNGEKILGIEEIQSDWATSFRIAFPNKSDVEDFFGVHGWRVMKVVQTLFDEYGFFPSGYGTIVNETTALQVVQEGDSGKAWAWLENMFGWSDTARIMSSALTSETVADELLKKVDPILYADFQETIKAWKALKGDINPMPWTSSYPELGLRAVVAWAIEEGSYDMVAWPEGGQVAQLYGGHMGALMNGLRINPKTMTVQGSYEKTRGPDIGWDQIAQGNMSNPHGNMDYDVDYLEELIIEKGDNAAVAKDAIGALQAWIDGDRDLRANLDPDSDDSNSWLYKIAEINNPHLKWDKTTNELLVSFPDDRLMNAKIHKLLYNQMLLQAARTMTTKKDKTSIGKVFIEDAWNKKVRGSQPTPGGSMSGGVHWSPWSGYDGDHYPTDFDMNTDAHERNEYRKMQLFGRDGLKLREAGLKLFEDDGYINTDIRPDSIGVNSKTALLWTRLTHKPIEMDTMGVGVYGSTDKDDDEPFGTVLEAVGGGMELEFPGVQWTARNDHGLLLGAAGNATGHTHKDTTVPYLYRLAYNVMRWQWGIRDPNPFAFTPAMLGEMFYSPMFEVLKNMQGDEAVDNTNNEAFFNVYLKAKEQYDNIDRYDESEPEDYELLTYAPEDHIDKLNPRYGIEDGIAKDEFIEHLKEHMTIKNTLQAAMVRAILMPAKDAAAIQDIEALWDTLPAVGMGMVPKAYKTGTESAAPPTTAPPPPRYDVNNPERTEQVWHALKLTDKVKAKPVYMNFSLKDDGNQTERALVNSKIAKSNSAMTVLDRVSNWSAAMTDQIRTGDLLWGMKQGVLDSAASVERWEKQMFGGEIQDASVSAHKMMHMTKNLPSVMAAISKVGIPAMVNGVFQPVPGRKGFVDILRPIYEHPEGDLLELWEGYAAARRSAELLTQKNEDGTQREKLFDAAEVTKLLALSEKYPIFDSVFNDWTSFNNDLLNLAVDRGVISIKERDAWSANIYVPFYRAMEEIEGIDQRTRGHVKVGVQGQQSGIRRLRGSDKKLGNITENMWFNTASLIDKIYKNEAMSRVVDMLEGVALTKIDMPWEAIRTTNAELARALGKAGLVTGTPDEQLNTIKEMTTEQRLSWNVIFRRVRPTANNVVSVMRSGKLVYYEVEDEDLLRTLQGLGAEGLAGMMKVMGMSKSLLTRMITVDPGFMLANWMRDTLSAWVTSDAGFTPVLDSAKAAMDVFREDGTFVKMMMSGAGGGGFYDLTGGNVVKALDDEFGAGANSWLSKAWRGYMKIGSASENSNRLAIANKIIANGGTTAEGMYQAQDVMNFTMSGDYEGIRFLIRTVPFLNARLQGTYKLYRGARDNPIGFMLKGAAITGATMALLAKNWDDEDYERLEGWQKDTYWNFFVDGFRYTIPKPFEVGLIFATLPERVMRSLLQRDDLEVTADALARGLGETLAFNPIPQLFKPLYEQGANKNLFTGAPIVNMAMSGLEHQYQASPWTSPAAQRIGAALPEGMGPATSPLRIQHIVRAYTGTVGLYALNSVDWVLRQTDDSLPSEPTSKWYERPVLSRVIRGDASTDNYNKYSNEMYEVIDESNKAVRTLNMLVSQGRFDEAKAKAQQRAHVLYPVDSKLQPVNEGKGSPREAILEVQKGLREISAASRAIRLSKTMDGDAKRSRLDELTKRRHELLASAASLMEKLDEIEEGTP